MSIVWNFLCVILVPPNNPNFSLDRGPAEAALISDSCSCFVPIGSLLLIAIFLTITPNLNCTSNLLLGTFITLS